MREKCNFSVVAFNKLQILLLFSLQPKEKVSYCDKLHRLDFCSWIQLLILWAVVSISTITLKQ